MIRNSTIWHVIKQYAPKRQWVTSAEIYNIVESHTTLDIEDTAPQSPMSNIPKWKLLVRNVLVNRVQKGKLRWEKDHNSGIV